MHIVHGPKGGTSVPKAVGHCVRMRTGTCRTRGTSLGAMTTGIWTGFVLFFLVLFVCVKPTGFFLFCFFTTSGTCLFFLLFLSKTTT